MAARTPKPKRRRERGDDGIHWDKVNKCYQSAPSRSATATTASAYGGTVRGKTKTEVKDKLDGLHKEIKAGIETPATYTVRQCVTDWLDSLELDPHTHGHVSRPGREVDLSEDRQRRSSRTSRPPTPTGSSGTSPRCSARPVAGEDQEHAGQVDPASAEVRPHRQERRRARRPAAGPARAPVAGHDRRAGQQGTQGRGRPGRRASSRS